ncbi:hypothetical protein L596_007385 [Steinernema carpocapsae]|uniref:Uncharacterized protein n=1 Tax=Steinernema carpocapsae TaxID=34508 RepID=A0A4U5P994_STECR|nr:hypothetical protein L596_007385 [Steinernema carpocapsae]
MLSVQARLGARRCLVSASSLASKRVAVPRIALQCRTITSQQIFNVQELAAKCDGQSSRDATRARTQIIRR